MMLGRDSVRRAQSREVGVATRAKGACKAEGAGTSRVDGAVAEEARVAEAAVLAAGPRWGGGVLGAVVSHAAEAPLVGLTV